MAWYKSPAWEEFLVTFAEWWDDATEFVNFEATEPLHKSFGWHTTKLVDFLYDFTDIDPMPLWDFYLHARDKSRKLDPRRWQSCGHLVTDISLLELSEKLFHVQMIYERIQRVGVVDKKPDEQASEARGTTTILVDADEGIVHLDDQEFSVPVACAEFLQELVEAAGDRRPAGSRFTKAKRDFYDKLPEQLQAIVERSTNGYRLALDERRD